MSFLHDAASVNSSNATILAADSIPIYHVIQVRMLALVVDSIGYARRISTVSEVTAAPKAWGVVLMNHGVTRRVHSLYVSPLFPIYFL